MKFVRLNAFPLSVKCAWYIKSDTRADSKVYQGVNYYINLLISNEIYLGCRAESGVWWGGVKNVDLNFPGDEF